MRVIMIGCEYAGKTTLAAGVSNWLMAETGASHAGWHDHFVMPHVVDAGPNAAAEEVQLTALRPSLLEKFQRYMIQYHLGEGFYHDNNHLLINWYYADAVYAPLYYGYGGPGEYADRRMLARWWDADVMKVAPDTVLVLVKATPEDIRQRMHDDPRPECPLREEDVELVLRRFDEEYEVSLIRRRFTLDTTERSIEETVQAFIRDMIPFLTSADHLRMVNHHRPQQEPAATPRPVG